MYISEREYLTYDANAPVLLSYLNIQLIEHDDDWIAFWTNGEPFSKTFPNCKEGFMKACKFLEIIKEKHPDLTIDIPKSTIDKYKVSRPR